MLQGCAMHNAAGLRLPLRQPRNACSATELMSSCLLARLWTIVSAAAPLFIVGTENSTPLSAAHAAVFGAVRNNQMGTD
jgi:hypothetical protein